MNNVAIAPLPSSQHPATGPVVATNVRRLMARHGLTYADVVAATGLDERTLRSLIRGQNNPHARTLHKLAQGLGVSIDELFHPLARSLKHRFDQLTNPLVKHVVETKPDLFQDWRHDDFAELTSHFGTGGALTEEGVVTAAEAINAKHKLLKQVSVILETGDAKLLAEFVDYLYRRVTLDSEHDQRQK